MCGTWKCSLVSTKQHYSATQYKFASQNEASVTEKKSVSCTAQKNITVINAR
jgi:hypothetical protein